MSPAGGRGPEVLPRLSDPPAYYDRGAEAQFRRQVQNALARFQALSQQEPVFVVAEALLDDSSGDLSFRYRLNEPYGVSVGYAWSLTEFPTREEVLERTHVNYGAVNSPKELNGYLIEAAAAPDVDDEVFFTAVPFAAWESNAGLPDGLAGEEYQQHIRVPASGADSILPGTISADKLTAQGQRFTTDIEFSAVDRDTVQWSAGQVVLANGDVFNVVAGNTGTLSGLAYVYLDRTVSTTQFQVTSNFANVASDEVLLMAVVQPGPTGAQNAFFVPAVGVFGINEEQLSPASISSVKIQDGAISAPKILANAVSASKIQAGAVTAGKILAGAVTAGKIAANAVTAAKINVVSLEAVSANMGVLRLGLMEGSLGSTGIFLSPFTGYPNVPASWTRYLNLHAAGAQPFLKHPSMELLANGNANFSGVVSADTFTSTNVIFDGSLEVRAGSGTRFMWLSAGGLRFFDGSGVSTGNLNGGGSLGVRLASQNGRDITLEPGTGMVSILGDLSLEGLGVSPSAGSQAGYLEFDRFGTTYKIPYYNA